MKAVFLIPVVVLGLVASTVSPVGANRSAPSRLPAWWAGGGGEAGAFFGISVGTAGDVNADGYADVIVGASHFGVGHGQTDEGRAGVFFGSSTRLTGRWVAESNQKLAYFGGSVGTAGDVNGDGYDDVIVGARFYDDGQDDEGAAFVYQGSANGPSITPDWTAEPDQNHADFGFSVGTAGDVNGDGYDDVIVGAPQLGNDKGRAFVYLGSGTGLSTTPDWIAQSDQAGAFFGSSVGTAGDVNGDGYDDVIVGAPQYSNDQVREGRAFVYPGSATGLSKTPNWTAESDQFDAYFGISSGAAGDVNGDGYADVIVGAFYYDDGQTDEGRAFVYEGSATGLSKTPNWTAESDQELAHFSDSGVGTAGDVNADGYADVIVGASQYDDGQDQEGAAFVYIGSATGLSITPEQTIEIDQPLAYLGASGTAGDINGDGYDDVIVGAYGYDHRETNEGAAFVYVGPV